MQKIKITGEPLWIRGKRGLLPGDHEKKAAFFMAHNLKDYLGANADSLCVSFTFVDDQETRSWIAFEKLITAVENADVHIVNPEVLMHLINMSRVRKKESLLDALVIAIQKGDYKEVFEIGSVV